jgi:hypothetical protein
MAGNALSWGLFRVIALIPPFFYWFLHSLWFNVWRDLWGSTDAAVKDARTFR